MVLQQSMVSNSRQKIEKPLHAKNIPITWLFHNRYIFAVTRLPNFLTRDLVTPLVYFLGSNRFEPVC